MDHLNAENPEELLLMLIALLAGGLASVFYDLKVFIQVHSFLFHMLMSAAQWCCYVTSFGVGIITICKFFKKRGYK